MPLRRYRSAPRSVRKARTIRFSPGESGCPSYAPRVAEPDFLSGPAPGLDPLFRLAVPGDFLGRLASAAVSAPFELYCRRCRVVLAPVGGSRVCFGLALWFQRLEQVRLVGLSVGCRIGQIDEPARHVSHLLQELTTLLPNRGGVCLELTHPGLGLIP